MEEQEIKRTYMCCFCLSQFECTFGNPPERCSACHVCKCNHCHTFLKGDNPKFCHGCGKVNPSVEGRFVGTYQTACIYHEQNWKHRNLGQKCEKDVTYEIHTGYGFILEDGSIDMTRTSSWLYKRGPGFHDSMQIRELTEEEKSWLKTNF